MLRGHLEIVVRACINRVPTASAIVLYGSYGRGEGAWYAEADGKPRPYNDYDFCIVGPEKLPPQELAALRREIEKATGLRWIDVTQLSPVELRVLPPLIRNYDLKYAARVVYGDARVLDLIPAIDSAALTSKDVEILYFTRLYTLLGSLGAAGVDAPLAGDASRFFRNQMAKAILAVVDVLLLARRAYDASYHRRVARVAELYSDKSGVISLSRWALAEKLEPRAPDMSASEVRDLYSRVHRIYVDEMYDALSRHFRQRILGAQDIERIMKRSPARVMKRLLLRALQRSRQVDRELDIVLAQSYLVDAWRPAGADSAKLASAVQLLRRADPGVPADSDWDAARVAAVSARG